MKRSRRLVLFTAILMAVPAVLIFLLLRERELKTVTLPGGAALHILGVDHGRKQTPGTHLAAGGTHRVDFNFHTQMDGEMWEYSRTPGLRERIYGSLPPSIRQHFPESWGPPAFDPFSNRHEPFPEALKYSVSGAFDTDRWSLTWVDRNGFEADHPVSRFQGAAPDTEYFLHFLPPCHSPEVTLRIRERVPELPVSQWPLVAEMRMKNPCLLPPSTIPVVKLPASITSDDLTATLHSLRLDPNAPVDDRVTARVSLSPSLPEEEWIATMALFDERRCSSMHTGFQSQWEKDAIVCRTRTCYWTDAPWYFRLTIRPKPTTTPPSHRQARFVRVPLPAQDGPAKSYSDQSILVAGHPVSLVAMRDPHIGRGVSWQLDFNTPKLSDETIFRVLSARDDTGREFRFHSSHETGLSSPQATSSHLLMGASGAAAQYLDIVVGITAPPRNFDFHLMPELVPATPR